MSRIPFKSIVSCSSEDRIHCGKNLLQTKNWLSAKGSEERITCVVELDKSSLISSIEIGNDGSAFVELFVANVNDWTILLPATSLMTPKESRANTNRHAIKLFQASDLSASSLNEKWKRLKIVCEQKFNRSKQYGLAFVKLYSSATEESSTGSMKRSLTTMEATDDDVDETGHEQSQIGSLFAKKQAEKHVITRQSSSHDAAQTSSNVANELLSRKSGIDSQISPLPKKRVQSSSQNDNNNSNIMKNVVFVLSGFQNPLRSNLRTKATSMGATFNDDWNDQCTHLICAFPNTPKFTQVQQAGNCSIVNKQWILDCFDQNRFLSEKSYELKENHDDAKKKSTPEKAKTSTTNTQSAAKRKAPMKKKSLASNVNADETNHNTLPDFFHDTHFYVSYGDYDDSTLLDIIRVILAYDGILERQINSNVKYVITKRLWNQDFEKISKTNPEINFVSIDWLQDCHDENSFAPIQPYLIVP